MVCAVRHLEGLRPRAFARVATFCRPARSVASSLVHADHKRWLRLAMIVAAKPAPPAVLLATTALGGIAMLGDFLKPQGLGKSLGNNARRRGSIPPTTGLLDVARTVAVFETYARERRCRDLEAPKARLERCAASRCHRAGCHRANCHRDGVAMGCQLGSASTHRCVMRPTAALATSSFLSDAIAIFLHPTSRTCEYWPFEVAVASRTHAPAKRSW
jgi:hypothetical protein